VRVYVYAAHSPFHLVHFFSLLFFPLARSRLVLCSFTFYRSIIRFFRSPCCTRSLAQTLCSSSVSRCSLVSLSLVARSSSLVLLVAGSRAECDAGPPKGALHSHRVLLGHLPGVEFPQNMFPQTVCFFSLCVGCGYQAGSAQNPAPRTHLTRVCVRVCVCVCCVVMCACVSCSCACVCVCVG
jgi:hypothetical protein